MNLYHYLRWIRRWHVDYTADNWREQNEQRWNAFCSWRAGELPEDIEAAVTTAQFEAVMEPIYDMVNNIGDALLAFSAVLVDAFTPLAEQMSKTAEAFMVELGNGMESLGESRRK